ncbi:WecB/TagA/CpsF family glycosyltransferase [Streptomyces sp. NPDC050418]|uniref:WecB/TagA/CpsF family glycosyltransferase n=1 Tax=Streptomyces sp. NPDC050418 TaxID=3365612 RepID=UPI0037AD7919
MSTLKSGLYGGLHPARRGALPPVVTAATVPCTGVPVAAVTPADAAAAVIRLAAQGGPADVHLCTAASLALADADPELHRLLRASALNLPAGRGVVHAGRLLHRDRTLPRTRVDGSGLLLDVFRTGQAVGLRHYLLGPSREVLDALTAALLARNPRARIVGTEAPPRRGLTDAERVAQSARIAASGAQIIWLGLAAPRRDHEAARLAALHPAVYVAAGRAAFDAVAGTGPQPPQWLRGSGLERLYPQAREERTVAWGSLRFAAAVLRTRTKGTGR